MLSVTGRAAIHGQVPMFGVQAPTPGSGEGLLADAAAMIPTGCKAPLMAPTEEDEETRKRLLAIAIESPSIVVIDNVRSWARLGGAGDGAHGRPGVGSLAWLDACGHSEPASGLGVHGEQRSA